MAKSWGPALVSVSLKTIYKKKKPSHSLMLLSTWYATHFSDPSTQFSKQTWTETSSSPPESSFPPTFAPQTSPFWCCPLPSTQSVAETSEGQWTWRRQRGPCALRPVQTPAFTFQRGWVVFFVNSYFSTWSLNIEVLCHFFFFFPIILHPHGSEYRLHSDNCAVD